MRTAESSRTVSGFSLTDFTRTVRDARAINPSPGTALLKLASDTAPTIPPDLIAAAGQAFDAALAGRHPVDPMLGSSLSRLISAVNAAVKRSGPLIERAIVAGLERAGYIVMRHVAMPVTDAASNLVTFNEMRALRGVAVAADAPADGPTIVYDLLVYCPKTRRAVLIEVKRGNGATELRKVRPITAALKAGSLQVHAHLKRLGLKVRDVDAKLVDYYGHSGFDDDIRITGDKLDQYFGAPVQGLIEAVLGEVRIRLFAVLPQLLAQAMAEAAHGPDPQPRMITLANGIKIAPEHVRSIELPPRRRGRPKRVTQIITLPGVRRGSSQPPATVQ